MRALRFSKRLRVVVRPLGEQLELELVLELPQVLGGARVRVVGLDDEPLVLAQQVDRVRHLPLGRPKADG